jgi:hypothetical protein
LNGANGGFPQPTLDHAPLARDADIRTAAHWIGRFGAPTPLKPVDIFRMRAFAAVL